MILEDGQGRPYAVTEHVYVGVGGGIREDAQIDLVEVREGGDPGDGWPVKALVLIVRTHQIDSSHRGLRFAEYEIPHHQGLSSLPCSENDKHTHIMQGIEGPQRGDLARRMRHRRLELGLSIEELAAKAGISPVYLGYFEEHENGILSAGSLRTIARALDTSPGALLGDEIDRPPGRGRATGKATLRSLTQRQCRTHLASGGIGRLLFIAPRGPVALPVNYALNKGEIHFVTDLFKAMSLESQARVSLEIDRIDDRLCEGWSVVASGVARRLSEQVEADALDALGLKPWAGGNRHVLVAMTVDEMTGRVIVRTSSQPGVDE